MTTTFQISNLSEQSLDALCELLYQSTRQALDEWHKKRKIYLGLAATGIVVAAIGLFVKITLLAIAGSTVLIGCVIAFASMKANITLERLGIVGISIQEYHLQSGVVLVDRSGLFPPALISYPSLSSDTIGGIGMCKDRLQELLNHMPIVLSSNIQGPEQLSLEESQLVKYLEELVGWYHSKTEFTESMAFVVPDPVFLTHLDALRVFGSVPLVPFTEMDADILSRLDSIEGIWRSASGTKSTVLDIDDLSQQILDLLDRFFPRYNQVIDVSLREVNYRSARLHNERVGDLALNRYCPHCNSEQIARMKEGRFYYSGKAEVPLSLAKATCMTLADPVLRIWKCPVCERSSAVPFEIHKLDDQLFKSVYERLGEENRVERMKIYSGIMDQKRLYAEKADVQMQQVMRESRAKADQIKSKLRSINAEIAADQMAIEHMALLLLKYKQMGEERAREYEREVDTIKANIATRTEQHQRHLDEEYAHMKKEMNDQLETYKSLEREEERVKFSIQVQMLQALDTMKTIEVARAERERLFGRSNWTPLNRGL